MCATVQALDFTALQQRLRYSSPTRTVQLAGRMPASLIAFDVLQRDGHDLRPALYDERRAVLEAFGRRPAESGSCP